MARPSQPRTRLRAGAAARGTAARGMAAAGAAAAGIGAAGAVAGGGRRSSAALATGTIVGSLAAPYAYGDGYGGCYRYQPVYDAYGVFIGNQLVNVCY